MAQLKDTNVAGNLRVTNTILTNEIKIFDTIKFANTSAVKHILFTRITSQGGPSYICYPSNGQLAIGTEIGYDNAIAVFDGTSALRPGKTNTFNLGTNDQKWKNVYATTFVGALTGNADTATKFSSTRKIELTGAVTGSATTNGENGWTIDTSVNHNHNDLYVNVDGDTITGPIRRFYTANSEEPMFQLVSNDKTVYLWKIAHGSTSTENTSLYAGFGLQYYGEGSGRANYLRLKADNQGNTTKYTALCIDQQGRVGLGDDAQENYQLYSKGAALIARNSSSTTTILSSQLVVADLLSGTGSGNAPALELYRHQKTCWQIINGTDGKLSVRSNYTNAVQSTYLPVLYRTSADGRIIEWHDYILTKGTNPSSDTTNTQVIGYFGSGTADADRAWEHRSLITSAGTHQYYIRAYGFKSGSTSNSYLRFGVDINNGLSLYTNSTFYTEGSSVAYSNTAFISSHTKSPNGCIRFDTRSGTSTLGSSSKITYTTSNQSSWGMLYVQVPVVKNTYATAGDTSSEVTKTYNDFPTKFFFRVYSYNDATAARMSGYEDYALPPVTANKTDNATYTIITTKHWTWNRNDAGTNYLYTQQNYTTNSTLSLDTLGAANTEGWITLTLGNNLSKSSNKNASGRIKLYSSGSKCHIIRPSTTAITSTDITHYLPNTAGWIVTAGDGTSTGAGSNSQPVYISENGIATAISTINIAYGGTGISTTDPHKVLIGAVSGSTASAPTWRTIDNADLPGQGKITIAGTAVSLGGSISLATMGLSNALHFIGITTTDMTGGTATNHIYTGVPGGITNYTTPAQGDVVINNTKNDEWVCTTANGSNSKWERLGSDTSYKIVQSAVNDPSVPTTGTTTSTSFIDTISQNANGVISVTKKNLPTATTEIAGITTVGASGGAAAYSHGVHVSYGTSTEKIGTAAAGSASTVSRSNHVHAIDLETGDNNGQVKIANTNVTVKGIEEGYLNIHAENAPIFIPFMHNDIAFLLQRNGSATIKYDDVVQNVDISTVFSGREKVFAATITNIQEITIELTLHTTFKYTTTIYVDFGSTTYYAKNVKIETALNDGAWTTRLNSNNRTISHASVRASYGSGGFNKIRYTFSNWAHGTNFRITQLGVYNYSTSGITEVAMSRGIDDPVFRDITPNDNNTYNLGSSSKKWANVYATTFNGDLIGTITSYESRSYDSSGKGWAFVPWRITNVSGTFLGGIGAKGSSENLDYLYIGSNAYNESNLQIYPTGQIKMTYDAAATSNSTGTLIVSGGIATKKSSYFGGDLTINDTTAASTTKQTGQLIIQSGTGSNAVAIELYRNSNVSWQLYNVSGNLQINNNFSGTDNTAQSTYKYKALEFNYQSLDATFAGKINAAGGELSGDLTLVSGHSNITNVANKRINWYTTDTTPVLVGYMTISNSGNLGIHSTGDIYLRPGTSEGAISTETGAILSNSTLRPNLNAGLSLGTSSIFWQNAYIKTTVSEAIGKDGWFAYPYNGIYTSRTSTVTGAIKIKLPQLNSQTMISFDVYIFTYVTVNVTRATYHISGYVWNTDGWASPSQLISCNRAYSDGIGTYTDLPVRFYKEDDVCCVSIGELTTSWSYPQVAIANVHTGFGGYSVDKWATGWSVTIDNNAFPEVIRTTIQHPNNQDICITGNANTASLLKPVGDTISVAASTWGVVPNDEHNIKVWSQKFTTTSLKWMDGETEKTVTDSGDLVFWLSNTGDESLAYLNMRIDGTIQAKSFIGNASTATTATKVAQTVTTSSYGNWRPLLLGSSNSSTEGFDVATVSSADTYAAHTITVKPNTGLIRAGALKLTNNTGSTSTSTGSLVVSGGAGISEKLYVGSDTQISGNLTISKSTATVTLHSLASSETSIILERHNGTNMVSSWKFKNASGTLYLQNNWMDGAHETYQNIVTYAHTTGDITIGQGNLILAKAPTSAMHATTKQYVDGILAANNAMTFKGTINSETGSDSAGSTNRKTLPASHTVGDTYRVTKADTYAGQYCEVGTLIICVNTGTTANDADWTSVETNEDGSVIGPTSSTANTNSLAYFSAASGRVIAATAGYINYLNHAEVKRSGETSVIAYQDGLKIIGTSYGDAAGVLANENGTIRYGDGGPQIQFITGQNAAIIYSHHDNTSQMQSAFHFVGQQTVAVKADGLIAKSKAIIGGNSTTSYTLYSNGATYINGTLTMNGIIHTKAGMYEDSYSGALNMNNSNIYGLNSIYTADTSDGASEGIHFYRSATTVDSIWVNGGNIYFAPNRIIKTDTTTAVNTSAANSEKITRLPTTVTDQRAVYTDGTTGKLAISSVTSTELSYLSGVTSAIQTQLNNKSDSTHNHNSTYLKLSGGTLTGGITIKPDSGEGGQINLSASTANTNQAGISIDQYNSTFRIFGIASADGTTKTGTGTPLVIDPYAKTITGGYTFTGNLTGNVTGNVTGDLNGRIFIVSTADCSTANNGGTTIDTNLIWFGDVNSNGTTRIRHVQYASGKTQSEFVVRNYNSSENTWGSWHGITILAAKDNTATYTVTDAANFRSAISALQYAGNLSTLGNDSPHDATKTWWENTANVPKLSVIAAYNNKGAERTLIFSKGNADATYGTVLSWGYTDQYIYILRKKSSTTWLSSDWEKIYAGYADTAPWSGITSNPISFAEEAYGDTGWQKLDGTVANTSTIKIRRPTDLVTWGTQIYSSVLAYGVGNTKGMIDIGYSSPLISIAGGNVSDSTNAAPRWYFKLSATTGQTYTFPSATCTLASSTDAVKVNYSTTSAKAYLMGSANAPTSTKTLREAVGNSNIYINATNGLSAVQHTFNDGSGNDKAYVQYNPTDDSLDFVFA